MTTTTQSTLLLSEKTPTFIGDIFSLTKPRLSSLVILTSALGMWLAPGSIDLWHAAISIIATSGLVGGACAINCYLEKDIDKLMDRTKDRPLPSGRISETMALSFGLALMGICLLVLFYFINPLTSILGFIAAVVYILLYTPMKTRTAWALFAGAIPGAIPPLMGWTSVTGSIGILGVILFALLFIWQLPHFLSIAIYHVNDYNRADIKTHPGHIGISATIHQIGVYTLALFFISMLPFYIGAVTEGYKYAVLLIGGGYFVYSLWGHALDEGTPGLLQWARRYFYGSLIYLPCVFILMIYFRNIS